MVAGTASDWRGKPRFGAVFREITEVVRVDDSNV
jgi:hypothetical protein